MSAGVSLSKTHKQAIQASDEFRKYIEEMVEEERGTPSTGEEEGSLLQNFVNAAKATDGPSIPPAVVFSNLFIFILAGHETSADTMTFALALLACHQDFQRLLRLILTPPLETVFYRNGSIRKTSPS